MICCRTPHGVRGLKSRLEAGLNSAAQGRTPHGVRGLKFNPSGLYAYLQDVAPRTGCVD